MDKNEAVSVIQRYLTCIDIARSCNRKCEKCRYHTSNDEKELALKLTIKALGEDTNIPTNSALDHIHNVVVKREYQRGYEQGKKDAKVGVIPVDWIEAEIKKLRAMNFDLATMTAGQIEAMMRRWREEQNDRIQGE